MESTESLPLALRRPKRRAAEAVSPLKPSATTGSSFRLRVPKRARFSAGDAQNLPAGTTGLTPAVRKQRLATPRRRASTPAPSRLGGVPTLPPSSPLIEGEVQFTPLRQALDTRMQRRIRRNHLSEEINDVVHDKREMGRLRKEIQAKDEELKRMRAELDESKTKQTSPSSSQGAQTDLAGSRISEIEQELDHLRRSFQDYHDNPANFADEGSVLQPGNDWNDVARGTGTGPRSDSGDTIQIYEDSIDPYSSTQQLSSNYAHQDAQDAAIMGLELESARQAKQSLLGSFSRRTTLDASDLHFADSPSKPTAHASSPLPKVPGDLYVTLSKQLKAANNRAEDAELALEALEGEIRALCSSFSEGDAQLGLKALADHFRAIRLELENLMPGESVLSLANNAGLFPELVGKLKSVMSQLTDKSAELQNMRSQERNLRSNFDHALQALEKANNKVKRLDDDIDKMAEEMLEMRVRAKQAEDSRDEALRDNDKLKLALDSYRGEISQLEKLIATMEAEHLIALEDMRSESKSFQDDMQAQVAAESTGRRKAEESAVSRLRKIQELEDKLQDAKERAARVEVELKEEIGGLTSRVGTLSNALQAANAETGRLRKLLQKCERKYRDEVFRGDEAVSRMREEMMKAAVRVVESSKAYRRKSKVGWANWELESDDVAMDEHGAPMTPSSVVRFADYSEVRDLGEEDGAEVDAEERSEFDDDDDDNGDDDDAAEEEEQQQDDEDRVPGSVETSRGRRKSVLLTPALKVSFKPSKGKRRYDSGIGISDSSPGGASDLDDSGLATPDLSSDGMEMDGAEEEVRMAF